jgi:hypothetical protein
LFTAVYSLTSFLALSKLEVQHPFSVANGQEDGPIKYVLKWAHATVLRDIAYYSPYFIRRVCFQNISEFRRVGAAGEGWLISCQAAVVCSIPSGSSDNENTCEDSVVSPKKPPVEHTF